MCVLIFLGHRDKTLVIFLSSAQTCKDNLKSLLSGSLDQLCVLQLLQ